MGSSYHTSLSRRQCGSRDIMTSVGISCPPAQPWVSWLSARATCYQSRHTNAEVSPCHSLLAMRQRAPCTSRTTQPRAALSLGIPTILSTRRRLSANTGKLHSVRTFSSPRMKQSPASHHLCMVPNGCATCAWRRCMPSGRRRPRCALAARRGSSTHRVIRRPSWLRVHACLIAQALQTDVA
jgi:hypothetical protein